MIEGPWEIFDEVLREKRIPRELVIYPERWQDQVSCTKRREAILECLKRGVPKEFLPFTGRYNRKILKAVSGNGRGPNI